MSQQEKKVTEKYTVSDKIEKCYHSFLKLKVTTGEKICVSCGQTISN
ncbi:MAG: hypothetical protein V4565_01940 [Bacteroidota bacterium]